MSAAGMRVAGMRVGKMRVGEMSPICCLFFHVNK